MLTLDPQERADLWARATTGDDQGRRYAFLKHLAEVALDEAVASHFNLYDYELREQFVASLWVLDEAGALDTDMLRIFQGIPNDPAGASERFLGAMIGRLGELAAQSGAIDARLREQAGRFRSLWREYLPEQLLTIREVADRYDVTDKAVYKWIKDGKVRAERTPGGSIRGIPASELAGGRSSRRLATLATTESIGVPVPSSGLVEHLGVTPAFEAVLADRAAGRTHQIPRRGYDAARLEILEREESASTDWSRADRFATEYPEGFIRRPAFRSKRGRP